MNTQHCQTCSYWDQAHGLEMTSLGAIAPCTRRAPTLFSVESVDISEAAHNFAALAGGDGLGTMEIPMALWPYTDRNQCCGDYQPCDLQESARRNRIRSVPLI